MHNYSKRISNLGRMKFLNRKEKYELCLEYEFVLACEEHFLFMNYFGFGSEINKQPVIDVKQVEGGSQTLRPHLPILRLSSITL